MKPEYITDYVKLHANNSPAKTALVVSGNSYDWQSIDDSMRRIAGFLSKRLEANNQQVVAVMLPNSWEFIVWYLAILELGHIVMPIDTGYKQLEIEAICNQIKPVLIITNRELKNNLKSQPAGLVLTSSMPKKQPLKPYRVLRLTPAEQIASLLFTSGTTGKPKAAPYTHANHIWNITASSPLWGWTGNDTMLLTLPLSHWYGLVMGLSGIIYHGNTLYLHKYPNTAQTLAALASGNISIFTHVAGVYGKLANRELKASYDFSRVRLCISGGAPLPPQVWGQFKDRFGIEIVEAYGSSETGRIASNSLEQRLVGSPGKTLPGVKVSLAKNGELLVKSPGLFPGYYKNQALTKSKYTKDGWWKTGDIAELKDGRVYLKSRLQERINKNGFILYPRDIEWALMQLQSIEEAFVLGLQRLGQMSDKIIYFIVGHTNEAEVMKHSRQNMPTAWLPDKVLLLPELPRTKSGKPELSKLIALVA